MGIKVSVIKFSIAFQSLLVQFYCARAFKGCTFLSFLTQFLFIIYCSFYAPNNNLNGLRSVLINTEKMCISQIVLMVGLLLV